MKKIQFNRLHRKFSMRNLGLVNYLLRIALELTVKLKLMPGLTEGVLRPLTRMDRVAVRGMLALGMMALTGIARAGLQGMN